MERKADGFGRNQKWNRDKRRSVDEKYRCGYFSSLYFGQCDSLLELVFAVTIFV